MSREKVCWSVLTGPCVCLLERPHANAVQGAVGFTGTGLPCLVRRLE